MPPDPAVVTDSIREAIALSFHPKARVRVTEGLASIRWLFRNEAQTEEIFGAVLVVASGDVNRFEELIENAGGYREMIRLVSGYDFRYPNLSHMELIQRYRKLNLPIPASLETFAD